MENAERRRKALAEFMAKNNINRTRWAREADVSEGGFRDFMNGRTDSISIASYEALAAAAKVSVSALLGEQVPVVGRVGAGQEMYPFDDHALGDGLEHVDAPPGLSPDVVVAVEVTGTSMHPIAEGWLLFYRRDVYGVPEECINKLCVCQIQDGPTYVKEVRRGTTDGTFTLTSWNAPPIENVELAWAAKVLDIRPR